MLQFKKIVSVLFLLALGLSGFGLSGCQGRSLESQADAVEKKVANELDLNVDQKEKLDEIKVQWLSNQTAQKERRLTAFDQAVSLIQAEHLDSHQLRSIYDQQVARTQANLPHMLELVAKFHDSLTPRQREKIVERLKKLKDRLSQRS